MPECLSALHTQVTSNLGGGGSPPWGQEARAGVWPLTRSGRLNLAGHRSESVSSTVKWGQSYPPHSLVVRMT